MKTSCPLTLIVLLSCVGYFSSSCSLTAALPLNTSMVVPASGLSMLIHLSNHSVTSCQWKIALWKPYQSSLTICINNVYKCNTMSMTETMSGCSKVDLKFYQFGNILMIQVSLHQTELKWHDVTVVQVIYPLGYKMVNLSLIAWVLNFNVNKQTLQSI